jgi:tetratricopeptide (TPR) repeat protein
MPAFVFCGPAMSNNNPAYSPIALEVERIRVLLREQQFEAAATAASALAARVPENRDALYLKALAERQSRRLADALATLETLERVHPNSSLLYQERGHCHVARKDAAKAIQAYEQAVRINPALPATWSMLEGLYKLLGQDGQRRIAAAHGRRLSTMPPDVIKATGLFCEGDLIAAEKLVRAHLINQGEHPEALRLLARVAISRDVLDEAEVLLEAAVQLDPDYIELRRDYACVMLDRHKHAEAILELDRLLAVDPRSIDYRTLRATAAVGLGEHEDGIRRFADVLADTDPQSKAAADLLLSIGHSEKTLGRRPEAVDAYHRAIAVRPNFGDAYWSLANLKTHRFTEAQIESLIRAEASETLSSMDRYHICFALGKAFEDRQEYATSWQYYARGNALKRAESKYRAELLEQNTRHQKRVCTRDFFATREGFGCAAPDPIFILGLPRAGSTLLEQILASHSQIEGTQELANIPRYALHLQGMNPDLDNPLYPASLVDLSREEIHAFGQKYIDDTRIYRTHKPYFIDKMPNNFRHVGLIKLILPNAKIIDARREPMACCFGNLKQLFARGQEFCYSINDIARYYTTYLDLMQHWDAALPGHVLRVHHEDVVDDLDRSVRRILDFLGLPFEAGCLEFHKNVRSVKTASSEQVRQPIYREGLDQWRHYEPWLDELKDALGDARLRYRTPSSDIADATDRSAL